MHGTCLFWYVPFGIYAQSHGLAVAVGFKAYKAYFNDTVRGYVYASGFQVEKDYGFGKVQFHGLSVVNSHGHEQHYQFFVLFFLCGTYKARTAGVCQLQNDILAIKYVADLNEELA